MSLFAFFSTYDLLIVAVVALLFFGNRLPSVMRSLGQGVNEFKKGIEGGVPDEPNPITGDAAKKLDDQTAKS